jgi:hypothetical protein
VKQSLIYGVAVILWAGSVYAQTFAEDTDLTVAAAPVPAADIPTFGKSTDASDVRSTLDETEQAIAKAFGTAEAGDSSDDALGQIDKALEQGAADEKNAAEDEADSQKNKEEDVFIPEGELYRLDTPTLDGSVRGGQAFVEVDDQGRMKKVTNIFLFYDDFRMTNTSSALSGCNVRFNILSNLDQKINRLDIKLVWPKLTTTLSFSDVAPNTQTYYNYALLGEGCYNMDKAPNIIVNRCRVKGMTAAECANKLIWLSK